MNVTVMVEGWASGPNSRGTIDILWGAFFTIFLCTWTVVCLNIPHPNDTNIVILQRKAKWMFWSIVGPELVLSVAIGQYASAHRSVQRMHQMGYSQWTLRHAFFADMGGFMLQPKNSSPFVVNARQLAYLVQHGYIQLPDITADEIWDRSKADTLAKLVTLLQACWLVFNLIGRTAQKLPITTLELSTGAIVFCTFGTFVCWLQKPNDVRNGLMITTNATTADILLQAGSPAAQPYKHTPLDFVSKESYTCGFDVLGALVRRCDHLERPLRRFPDDRFPDISTFQKFALFCMTTIYSGLHLLGWNLRFPSRTETRLWRISSLIITGTTVLFWIFETIAARQRFGRWDKYLIWLRLKRVTPTANGEESVIETDCGDNADSQPVQAYNKQSSTITQQYHSKRDAFEAEQKLQRPMPTWEVILLSFIVLIYVMARGYQMVESLVSLRKLPQGAYATFNVADLVPHW